MHIYKYVHILIFCEMAIKIEVFGVHPPCPRCKKTEDNARETAEKLEGEGFEVGVEKFTINSPEIISRYGILRSPAIAINGTVKIAGKVPDPGVIERLVREEIKVGV
jgi:hypothetical protein